MAAAGWDCSLESLLHAESRESTHSHIGAEYRGGKCMQLLADAISDSNSTHSIFKGDALWLTMSSCLNSVLLVCCLTSSCA
jgi:hypothetical protein